MTTFLASATIAVASFVVVSGCSSSSDLNAATATEQVPTQQTAGMPIGLLEQVDDALAGFDVLDVHLENHSGPTQLAVRVFADVSDLGDAESTLREVAGEQVDEIVLVTCPFTRSEMDAVATYVASEAWRSEGSIAHVEVPFEIGGAAGQTIGRGMWADCVVFLSVRDATDVELQALEAEVQELHVSYMIWSGSGSCEQGWYDELELLTASWPGPSGVSPCGG